MKKYLCFPIVVLLISLAMSGCESQLEVEESEPEPVISEEYSLIGRWSYQEVERKLEGRDTTLSIDTINSFLEKDCQILNEILPPNILLEKNHLRDGFYEFHYLEGELGDENYLRIEAFGLPEGLKHAQVQKGFRPESARQFEDTMLFVALFIEDVFYDWDEGREWFFDNLSYITDESSRTYFEHEGEYIWIRVSLMTPIYSAVAIQIESAE